MTSRDIEQDSLPQSITQEGGAEGIPRPRKKHLALIQSSLNRAIADGFKPYSPDNAGIPDSAVTETARRLHLPSQVIIKALGDGSIVQQSELYNSAKPNAELIEALRKAGIEVANDNRARMNVRRLTDEAQELRRTLKLIDRENMTIEEIREKIYHLSSLPPEVPSWVTQPKLSTGSPGVPVTIWSDWHYGETISAKEMSEKNEFGIKIADRRIKTLVETEIEIIKKSQGSSDFPGIVICLGGDLISGDNLHPELTDTNEAKTVALFPQLMGRLIWAIKRMADECGQVYLPCDIGNHGRNEQKPRFKRRAETSYEYLLYNQLEMYFANDPVYRDKVAFNITTGSGVHFTVGNHRYFLTHGDTLGVKGGDGIIGSIGPIKRGAIKTGASEASIGRDYDTIIMGHWHQHIPMQGIIVNGALKGWCEYARLQLRAPYDVPSQALWFNHPKYGPVTHHKVVVDDPTPVIGSNNARKPVLPLKKRKQAKPDEFKAA